METDDLGVEVVVVLKDIGTVSIGVVVISLVAFSIVRAEIPIGPILVALGLVPMFLSVLRRIRMKQILADIIFGMVDTGLMVAFSIAGGSFGGVVGAVVGAGVGDAITDAVAGFFEGAVAEKLRKLGIEEARTAIRSSLGKMTGCLFGSGFCITIAELAAVI